MKKSLLSLLLVSTSLTALPAYAGKEDKVVIAKIKHDETNQESNKTQKLETPSKDNNWTGTFTSKDNQNLINAANKGDDVAQDVMIQRWADKLLTFDGSKNLNWMTWEIVAKKIATYQGYAGVFFKYLDEKKDFQGKVADVVRLVKEAALDDKNPKQSIAQCNLGAMYTTGRGVNKDDKEAVKWYTAAAEQGHANAQCNLGVMYETGRGVDKDDKEAFKWYTAAAEQGDADAQCGLGLMYEDGRGVDKDTKTALMWILKSGDINAKTFIRNHLQPTSITIAGNDDHVFTMEDFQVMIECFDGFNGGYYYPSTTLYKDEGGFTENSFPIDTLHKNYTSLCTFHEKATKIINLLMEVETGFMVSCVGPTAAFNNLSTVSTTAVSQIIWDNQSFMLFGEKNHKIWKTYQKLVKDLDLNEGLSALEVIRFAEGGDGELKVLRDDCLLQINTLKENNKSKKEIDELTTLLTKAFKDKEKELKEKYKDSNKLHDDTKENLLKFKSFIKGLLKGNALKARNDKFMDEQFGK